MGELSKTIGEKGEKLVTNFMELIGWQDFQSGEKVTCLHPEEHKLKSSKGGRQTHGIDIFHSYRSNLQDFTLEQILCSVKYSREPYPNSPSTTFKAHLKDLAETIQCFSKSNLSSDNKDQYQMQGIEKSIDIGVLFWLNNNKSSDQDVVSKIHNINLDKSLVFKEIYVVDNSRAAFIYDTINYLRNNFKKCVLHFHYAFSSNNYMDSKVSKFGSVMPVEYLTADIIPFRLEHQDSERVSFCLACRESFSEDNVSRLISMASDVSQDFTGEFILLFPDYDELEHEKAFSKAKRNRGESAKNVNISICAFDAGFREMING